MGHTYLQLWGALKMCLRGKGASSTGSIPYRLHGKVIQDLHEGAVGAHLGEEKVLSQLKERFYIVARVHRSGEDLV